MVTDTPSTDLPQAEEKAPVVLFAESIAAKFPGTILSFKINFGEPVFHVTREGILAILVHLRDAPECRFSQLIDICAVDYPNRPERFEVVYQLLSIKHNARLTVKVGTDEDIPVPSVSSLFSSAPWFEREAWDLVGVMFDGLEDHRRILTDYGFDGHPLRKDFPLSGHVEVRYDIAEKRVMYGPVSLPQDFRVFDNLSPWEALTEVQLPGDEKANYVPRVGWKPVNKATE